MLLRRYDRRSKCCLACVLKKYQCYYYLCYVYVFAALYVIIKSQQRERASSVTDLLSLYADRVLNIGLVRIICLCLTSNHNRILTQQMDAVIPGNCVRTPNYKHNHSISYGKRNFKIRNANKSNDLRCG